jgi:anti-sigma-K factor RskA
VRDDTVAPVTPLPRRRRGAAVLLAAAAAVALAVGAAVVILASPDGDDPVEAVVEAPDVVVRTLEGSLGGTLTSYTSAGADAVVLRGSDVPTVGPTQTYQAWSIDEGGAASLGLFRPDDEGNVEVRFDDVTDVTVIGITLEPAGGSAQPTPPVLASA